MCSEESKMLNLKKMNTEEIEQLLQDAQAQLAERQKAHEQEMMDKIKALADEIGIRVSIKNVKKAKKVKQLPKVPAKYRDPKTNQTWSGRGRMPHWMREAINEGLPRESFLIDKQT
jgi:DNA-binding protein H-NS